VTLTEHVRQGLMQFDAECRGDTVNGPQHHVSVRSFYIGKYEVTQAQWRALMKSNPSEAEWEYACRAKTVNAYAGNLDAMAWYLENSDSRSHPVRGKQPNAYRLHDMPGNVWEWCEDDWHGSYANAPNDGSAWVEKPGRGSDRVIRGGSWGENGGFCRSAAREASAPGNRSAYNGFRLARTYR
jgi:formylglycine-generating enzyme required for sulfatase activity